MKKHIAISLSLLLLPACFQIGGRKVREPKYYVESLQEVIDLFPTSVNEIKAIVDQAKKQALKDVATIIAIPDNERTFENTPAALDKAGTIFAMYGGPLSILTYLSPDDTLREAAEKAKVELSQFSIDTFGQNVELYKAFKAYVEGNARKEKLTNEEQYFLTEAMKDFKRAGLELPEEQQKKVKKVKKELAELTTEFQTNLAQDNRTIMATKGELIGLQEDFINNLKRTKDGKFILGVDYPTYFNVMENAQNTELRKRLYHEFVNRAYPQNVELLEKIIAKRDALAQLLGFKSYAHVSIDNEMVQTPERVTQFLDELLEKSARKDDQEFEQLKQDLPEGVVLNSENKINPWDFRYAQQTYKKKHYNIDEREIAEYFPMENTIEELFNIYQKFFNLEFKRVPISGLWHEDIELIEVYKNGILRGYIFLDLYPRPNKFTHAAHGGIVPAIQEKDGTIHSSVGVVMANFPKSTSTKPSLLKRDDVKTFFHEFGHALHNLLGAQELGSTSGTSVKTDFVEMPSQMLEEWLFDKEILKKVSKHYKTDKPLPDELIDKIIALKNFSSGHFVQRQAILSFISLKAFLEGATKDILALYKKIYDQYVKHTQYYPEDHMISSFGHLTGYDAKYYSYLWSKVFALDLFDHIKKYGLLNPEIGEVYIEKVLSKGGGKDPNELLKDFLGREPNQEAFLKDLGLK